MELIIRTREGGERSDRVYQFHEIESLPTDDQQRNERPREIFFVTGSKNKVAEMNEHLKPEYFNLTVVDLDLTEIQDSDTLNIAEDKCRRALKQISKLYGEPDGSKRRCVLVEDTGVHFKAFKGLPGPYIKWFVEAIGPAGLFKMVEGFEDHSADAICTYALVEAEEPESRVVFFKGLVQGQIVSPRGHSWGWDSAFEESRTNKTYGEMDRETKSKFSHRANALTVMKKYLATVR